MPTRPNSWSIDYEPLPVVIDMDASATNEILLFPDLGTNIGAQLDLPAIDGLFDGADVVVEQRMINRRMAPAPMEGRVAAANWDGERLTLYASTQGVAATRDGIVGIFGLDKAAVRVVAADVGGGFGSKGGLSPEEIIVLWAALRLGGTIRWAETRSENLLAMSHGRGQVQTIKIGATNDGHIVGMHMDIAQEAGAYPDVGAGLPVMTMMMASGVYRFPLIAYTSRSYVTNTTPTGAFRGAGRPEAAYAIERTLDVLAAKLGLDPVELRQPQLHRERRVPCDHVGRHRVRLGRLRRRARPRAAGSRLRRPARRATASPRRQRRACNSASVSRVTSRSPARCPGSSRRASSSTATVRPPSTTGSTPHGQGHVTSWAMVASERLGIPMDRIEVLFGDTDRDPAGSVTGGSRSAQVCGVVVGRASDLVAEKAKHIAANLLEAAVDDVVLDTQTGRFHVAGTPAIAKTWVEVAAAATESLEAEDAFEAVSPTFPFGANVAVVEVDTETGRVTVVRFVGCDDAGVLLNPLLAEGQLHGGMGAGVAQALIEEIQYDDDGNPLTTNFADYGAISAAELPSFELVHMATPTPINELGAKGIGESGTVGATPAVINAVVDALSFYGIEHMDMPATPQRVWDALRSPLGDDRDRAHDRPAMPPR